MSFYIAGYQSSGFWSDFKPDNSAFQISKRFFNSLCEFIKKTDSKQKVLYVITYALILNFSLVICVSLQADKRFSIFIFLVTDFEWTK